MKWEKIDPSSITMFKQRYKKILKFTKNSYNELHADYFTGKSYKTLKTTKHKLLLVNDTQQNCV